MFKIDGDPDGVVRLAGRLDAAQCPAAQTFLARGRRVQLWDLAPMKILLEEAGGRFTDLAGKATVASGHALASNGLLHEHVLAALAPAAALPR